MKRTIMILLSISLLLLVSMVGPGCDAGTFHAAILDCRIISDQTNTIEVYAIDVSDSTISIPFRSSCAKALKTLKDKKYTIRSTINTSNSITYTLIKG